MLIEMDGGTRAFSCVGVVCVYASDSIMTKLMVSSILESYCNCDNSLFLSLL